MDGVSSPVMSSHLHHNHFPHLCHLCLPSSSGYISRVSRKAAMSAFPWSVTCIPSTIPIYVWFKFHFQHCHLKFLCCTFIFVGQFLLVIDYALVSLWLGNKKATQLQALLSACELSGKYTMTSHSQARLSKKWRD